ncbi:hypothetical protein ACFL25_00440 [Patescibacteria group bacterium]
MEILEDVIVKVTLKDAPKMLATAIASIETVHFGVLNIKGIVVWKSDYPHPEFQENINITFPRINRFGKWYDQVFLEDSSKWRQLQSRIYDAYHLKRNQAGKEKEGEEVNLDDIPL